MYKLIARFILVAGLGIIISMGFLIPNDYDMLYRMAGIVLAFVGVLQLLFTSKKYKQNIPSVRKDYLRRLKKRRRKSNG
ncbi:MAG: hypothetical protein GWP59_04100 [Chlamydiales bacterium]|nr:hypothetical protein [Chlamydiales bacterium]NCF70866.1 hypothetical protein [Chlamydiales bacterium]